MRRIIILTVIFILAFPGLAPAKGKKHCGPLWAVWTHSRDHRECMIKTTFWMVVITGSVCLTAKILTPQNAMHIEPRARQRWELAIWTEIDSQGKDYPVIGIKISW